MMALQKRWWCWLSLALLSTSPLYAGDWIHWRGPEQNGLSKETGLLAEFDLTTPGKDGLLWKQPVGGRSAPIVMKGKVFVITAADEGIMEGEKVVCFDENTGKILWESKFNVFHTDIVSSRLGWTSMTADPEKGYVYSQSTGGFLHCFNAEDGKIVWVRQLTEEFGRVTGYGGRISSPIFDSGLVIVPIITSSWGDQARGGNRFLAFDGKTGECVWITEVTSPTSPVKGTYYSNPVIAVINGQRLLICGGADGGLHAMKVRTGELMWSYNFSAGVVNPSPVVDGNLVYCCHGEENPEGGAIGRVICVDASKVKNKKPELVWEYRRSNRFGLASPALADGRLYIPDDSGELFCFDTKVSATTKKAKLLWRFKYGTVARGAPLLADGKLYIFDVNAKLVVVDQLSNEEPDEDFVYEYRFRARSGVGFPETNGTPIAVNGKVFFQTRDDIYCVGSGKETPAAKYEPLPTETPFDANAAPSALMIYPYEVSAEPSKPFTLKVTPVDANGRALPLKEGSEVKWSLPLPPKTPTGAQPPALNAAFGKQVGGMVEVTPTAQPGQASYIAATVGELTARGRVRVVPQIPYAQDFEKVPEGAVPGGWNGAQGKFFVTEVEIAGKKEKVLSKVNNSTRAPIARANGYITHPSTTNYTIQSDMIAGEAREKLPDMGVVNNRYLFSLDGKIDPNSNKRYVRIQTWLARDRVNTAAEFDWVKDTWYTLKFRVEVADGKAKLLGKVWKRGEAEPEKWTLEYEDPNPNPDGSAAVYGYVSNTTVDQNGSTIYFDNVKITPNSK